MLCSKYTLVDIAVYGELGWLKKKVVMLELPSAVPIVVKVGKNYRKSRKFGKMSSTSFAAPRTIWIAIK